MLSHRYKVALFLALAIFFTIPTSSANAFTMPEFSFSTTTRPTPPTVTTSSQSSQVNVTTKGEGEINLDTHNNYSGEITPTQEVQKVVQNQLTTLPPSTLITPRPSRIPLRLRRLTPTPTKQITPFPTKNLTPTPTQPTTIPLTPVTTNTLLDDKQQFILDAINAYRAQNNLSPVTADKATCDFATIHAKEIVTDFSHTGFVNRVNSKTLPYSGYQLITENIAMTSNYKDVVTMWINSPGHAANMRADTPNVCVAYSGNYYAYEGRRP